MAIEFSCDECNQIVYRIQVAGNHILVLDRNFEMLLEEGDEIEHSEGIHHVAEQGTVVSEMIGAAGEEVCHEKAADFALDLRGGC